MDEFQQQALCAAEPSSGMVIVTRTRKEKQKREREKKRKTKRLCISSGEPLSLLQQYCRMPLRPPRHHTLMELEGRRMPNSCTTGLGQNTDQDKDETKNRRINSNATAARGGYVQRRFLYLESGR